MKKTLVLIVLLSLALIGCGTPQPAVEYKEKIVYQRTALPIKFKEKCKATVPPDRKTYPTLSFDQKEKVLTTYAVNLIKDIAKCNNKVDQIYEFDEEQMKLLERINKQ